MTSFLVFFSQPAKHFIQNIPCTRYHRFHHHLFEFSGFGLKELPANVKEFYRQLEREVTELCGGRYARDGQCTRWGVQNGSVYLGGQRVAIKRQRVRDATASREVVPQTYRRYQDPRVFQEKVFRDGLRHVSQRDYKKGVELSGGAFGFSKSTVSQHWKRATRRQLEELQSRDLKSLNIVAVFIDGKRFGKLARKFHE